MGEKLIIHHWDTDGICSASILLKNLNGETKTVIPNIGNYFLTDEEIDRYLEYGEIYIVDIALPEDNIKQLAEHARVTIFDHHMQKPIENINHINPIAYGAAQEDFPSATWVLKEYFNEDEGLLVILGIVGDNEHKIKDNRRFYDIVQRFCRNYSIDFDDLVKATYLIDSNYKLGKKEDVERLPLIIRDMNLEDILTNREWNKNLEILEKEIGKIVNDKNLGEKRGNVIVVDVDIPYNIISTVTRRIAWNTNRDVVVVNRGFFEDRDQIYVRSSRINLTNLIDEVKRLGCNAGGKKSVVGIITSKKKTDEVIDRIVEFLEGKRW